MFLHALGSVAIIFLLTAIGYFCAAKGWMNEEVKQFINKFLLNIGIPVMCISELTTRLDREGVFQALPFILSVLCAFAAATGLAWLADRLFLHMPRERLGVFLTMCSVSNSLFVGLIMCVEIFGEESTPHVMMFYLADTFYIQMVCQTLIRRTGKLQKTSKLTVARFFKTPTVIGILTGLTLVLLNVKLPGVIGQTAQYVARTVTPLALLQTGYIIRRTGLKNLKLHRDHWAVMLFRFAICPALGMLVCAVAGISGLARNVMVVELAMPVLSMAVVYASAAGADETFAAEGAMLTTLACFLVTPLLVLLL